MVIKLSSSTLLNFYKVNVMKRIIVLCLFCLCGCMSTPVINQTDLSKVNFTELKSQKVGISCTVVYLGILPLETSASVAKAAWEAGIEKVLYVERYQANAWPLVYRDCVVVYGK